MQAGENGRELQKGEKYDWKQEDDTYTLIINNPVLEDDGERDRYSDEETRKSLSELFVESQRWMLQAHIFFW